MTGQVHRQFNPDIAPAAFGDKPATQAVGAVFGRVQAACFDILFNDVVDHFRVYRPFGDVAVIVYKPKQITIVNIGRFYPVF